MCAYTYAHNLHSPLGFVCMQMVAGSKHVTIGGQRSTTNKLCRHLNMMRKDTREAMHMYMYMYMHMYMYMYNVYVYIYICTCTCTCIRMYMYMYMNMSMYIYMYTRT